MWTSLSEEQEVFLNSFSNRVTGSIGDWYYIPFWFKKKSPDEHVYEAFTFDDLPDSLVKKLNKMRNND